MWEQADWQPVGLGHLDLPDHILHHHETHSGSHRQPSQNQCLVKYQRHSTPAHLPKYNQSQARHCSHFPPPSSPLYHQLSPLQQL